MPFTGIFVHHQIYKQSVWMDKEHKECISSLRCWSVVFMDTPDDQTVCEMYLFGLDCQNNLTELWGDQNIWIRVSPFLFASTSSALNRNPLKGFVLLENRSIDEIFLNFLVGTLVWPWGNGLVELPIGRPQSRRAAFQPVHKLSWSGKQTRGHHPRPVG